MSSIESPFNIRRIKLADIPELYLTRVRARYKHKEKEGEIEKYYKKRHGEKNKSEVHLLACCIYIGEKNDLEPYFNLYVTFAIPYLKQIPLNSDFIEYITFKDYYEQIPSIASEIPIFDPQTTESNEKNIAYALNFLYKQAIIEKRAIDNYKFSLDPSAIMDPNQTIKNTIYEGKLNTSVTKIVLEDKNSSVVQMFTKQGSDSEEEEYEEGFDIKIEKPKTERKSIMNRVREVIGINNKEEHEDDSSDSDGEFDKFYDKKGDRIRTSSKIKSSPVNNFVTDEIKQPRVQRFGDKDDIDSLPSWAETQIFKLKLQNKNKNIPDEIFIGYLLSGIESKIIAEGLTEKMKKAQLQGKSLSLSRFVDIIKEISSKPDELVLRELDMLTYNPQRDTPASFYRKIAQMSLQMFPDKTAGSKLVDLNFRKKVSPNDDMFPIISMNLEGEELVKFAENYLSQRKLAQLNNINKSDNKEMSEEPKKAGKLNGGSAPAWRGRDGFSRNNHYSYRGHNSMMKGSANNYRDNYNSGFQQNSYPQGRNNYQPNQRGRSRGNFVQDRQFGRQNQNRNYIDNRQRQNNPRLCHACSSPEHFVRECPLMNRDNVTCYACNQEGHFSRDCPQRQ